LADGKDFIGFRAWVATNLAACPAHRSVNSAHHCQRYLSMEIAYIITEDDFWKYNQFVLHRVLILRLRFYLRLLIIPVAIFGLFLSQRFGFLISLLAGCVTAAAFIPFILWNSRRQIKKAIRDVPGFLGKHTMRLLPDGLFQESRESEGLQKWSSFIEITQNTRHILFFLNKRYAYILPKSAFIDPALAEEFYQAALLFWKSVQTGQPPPVITSVNTWPPPPNPGS
jgi:hypothetical protein